MTLLSYKMYLEQVINHDTDRADMGDLDIG